MIFISIIIGNLYSSKRQMDRYDDYRRRKNDNNRQNSGRAIKYDSNRNYRGKHDNFEDDSPTNFKRKNRYNKGSNSHLNEKPTINTNNGNAASNVDDENGGKPNANRKNDAPWNKKRERTEGKDRRRQDDKPNRIAKFNDVKIDSANCSQREKLIREIDAGRLECLVCYDLIKTYSSVWSCPNCYHIMHLNCIIKWAESSKSDEGWRCCACQNISKTLPREYYCFCGKTKNPQYNRNDMAHTCGDVCGRTDGCLHPCTQLCHPGPCPQCQVRTLNSLKFNPVFILMNFHCKLPIKGDGNARMLLWKNIENVPVQPES